MSCRTVITAAALLALAAIAAAPLSSFTYSPRVEAALDRISSDSLRGNLSFLASDLLEGRDTPSRGLDVAAEFIAAQCRRTRLEPAGDDGYFQTVRFHRGGIRPERFELTWKHGERTVAATGEAVLHAPARLELENAPALTVQFDAGAPPPPASIAGKVVFAELPDRPPAETRRRLRALLSMRPALVVTFSRAARHAPRLVDEEEASVPWVTLRDDALAAATRAEPRGAAVSVRLAARGEPPITLRNVVGVLRGSDPALRDTAILVTAHYDHVGIRSDCGSPDCTFNGANDDASGVASVIEIANALSALYPRPRRSIVFMALFGEERGFLGSRSYLRRPVFPIEKTIANVNLEQLGRIEPGGKGAGTATFTGFRFSTLPRTFQAAGALTGITVYNSRTSNRYFGASDNIVFAQAGIPAHTACVAYTYPDYHGAGDHWDKIDYGNQARVTRMLALGILMLAEDSAAPRWNEAEPAAAPYTAAWKQRHEPVAGTQ